jgi:hypothetical protein
MGKVGEGSGALLLHRPDSVRMEALVVVPRRRLAINFRLHAFGCHNLVDDLLRPWTKNQR